MVLDTNDNDYMVISSANKFKRCCLHALKTALSKLHYNSKYNMVQKTNENDYIKIKSIRYCFMH